MFHPHSYRVGDHVKITRDLANDEGTFEAGHEFEITGMYERHGVPLFPSERKNRDGSSARATDDVFRRSLADAASHHLPAWSDGTARPAVVPRGQPGRTLPPR